PFPPVCILASASGIRSSVSEPCCRSSSLTTTSSCSCGSIRWGRRRFAPSTRSSKWSVSLRRCRARRLNRRDDPAPFHRLTVLLARRALERHDERLRRSFSVRSLHLRSQRDGLADDVHVHAGHVGVIAAGWRQAGNSERFFFRHFLTCLRHLAFKLRAVPVPFLPFGQQLRVFSANRLPGLIRLHDAIDGERIGLIEVAHLLGEFHLVCANL